MRFNIRIAIFALLFVCGSLFPLTDVNRPIQAAATDAEIQPHVNPDTGQKWRIAYCETDPYVNYAGTLEGILDGLEKAGWIDSLDQLPYTDGQDDSKTMWKWLSEHDVSPYLEFVADAHYSLADGGDELVQQIIDRLNRDGDIDLMIAMGTSAGIDLANDRHRVPVMVFSSSNAVRSGIIDSVEDPGSDHIWAHMDADRYRRQIQVFYDIFKFKTLGMVFENSEVGRIYAAVDDVNALAKEKGFQVVTRDVKEPASGEDPARYYAELLAANKELAASVDAVYLPAGKWDTGKLPQLLQPFYDRHIPVFSQQGADEVQHGALMSLYRANFKGVGSFGAGTIIQLLNGVPLRQLPQTYGDTPRIVFNLKVAEKIGYHVPFDVLLTADHIYLEIEE